MAVPMFAGAEDRDIRHVRNPFSLQSVMAILWCAGLSTLYRAKETPSTRLARRAALPSRLGRLPRWHNGDRRPAP